MGRQFDDAGSMYGAPMGRRRYGTARGRTDVRLFRVRLDAGGYDDGGAYWGIGHPLWCAWAPDTAEAGEEPTDFRAFTRAITRAEAAEFLGIKPDQLLRKL